MKLFSFALVLVLSTAYGIKAQQAYFNVPLSDVIDKGFQTDFDAGIVYQKLHLVGDWISGLHDFG